MPDVLEHKSAVVTFELKSLDEATGEFEGYGSTFGNVDLGGDIVAKGAFSETISDHAKAGTMPAMLFSHDDQEPIGDWIEMSEDKRGLRMKGRLWVGKGIPKAEQAYMMLKGRSAKGLSIGYVTTDATPRDAKGIRTLKAVQLHEVSPTPFPMNPKATVSSVKTANRLPDNFTKRDLENCLRDAGLSIAQSKALLASGYKAIDPRDADDEAIKQSLRNNLRILKG